MSARKVIALWQVAFAPEYVDHMWRVRRALECWENEKRLAAYLERKQVRAG